ncbi:MAG: hypothetical protein J7604_11465 [Sporocytophaga sp.]|uniref:hypothetical protein n=1 Tax=Sporocytophaga sp. TaxID=2231183 RepID=UPI001B2105D2|nr:hypothetical protein [Sporocytophaga sp.]MBO9700819.1 hypothetical protein [Sporocytophaga sp.]
MLEINGIWSIYYIGKNYKTSLWDKFIPIINQLIAEGGNDEVIANGRTMLNWISSSRKI